MSDRENLCIALQLRGRFSFSVRSALRIQAWNVKSLQLLFGVIWLEVTCMLVWATALLCV